MLEKRESRKVEAPTSLVLGLFGRDSAFSAFSAFLALSLSSAFSAFSKVENLICLNHWALVWIAGAGLYEKWEQK